MRRTRLSPEQTALARLLSRCSRDTADEGPALAARHRRLLMTAVEGEGGGKGADDALVQRKAVVAAEVEGWARARLQAVMQAAQGGAQHQWFCWEEQQQLRSRPVQQAAQGSTSQDGRSGPDPAARRIQAMWRRFQVGRRQATDLTGGGVGQGREGGRSPLSMPACLPVCLVYRHALGTGGSGPLLLLLLVVVVGCQ